MPILEPGTSFTARFHWRLDEALDIRAWADITVEVRMIDYGDGRYLCWLKSMDHLAFSHPQEEIYPVLLARLETLPGKFAFLPFEAAEGRTLFLKVGTLIGSHEYFFDETSDKYPRNTADG